MVSLSLVLYPSGALVDDERVRQAALVAAAVFLARRFNPFVGSEPRKRRVAGKRFADFGDVRSRRDRQRRTVQLAAADHERGRRIRDFREGIVERRSDGGAGGGIAWLSRHDDVLPA